MLCFKAGEWIALFCLSWVPQPAQKRARSWPAARTISVQISTKTAKRWRRWPVSNTWSSSVHGWHLLSRNPHQDCLSSGSAGQIKQDLAVHHHELRYQVQVVQVSCHLHLPPWLWNMDPACWLKKKEKDPGFRNQVPEETSPHRLPGAQDQRLGAGQDYLSCRSTGTSPGNCQETETCMVQACHATTASPKPSFRAPWRVGGNMVGRGKCWMDSIKEWTSMPMPDLLKLVHCRKDWKRISWIICGVILYTPPPPSDELNWTELSVVNG